MFSLPSRSDFSANWVSTTGKTREEFRKDQSECRRDTATVSSPGFGSPGGGVSGGGSWGMAEMKSFDNCMRSKGWVKK